MKLPKVIGCLFLIIGGNLQEQTTLVEGQGIVFRTWVRLPSSPLKGMFGITMFRAFFFITIKKDNISEKINKG